MKHKLIRSSVRVTIGDFAPAFVGYTEDVLLEMYGEEVSYLSENGVSSPSPHW